MRGVGQRSLRHSSHHTPCDESEKYEASNSVEELTRSALPSPPTHHTECDDYNGKPSSDDIRHRAKRLIHAVLMPLVRLAVRCIPAARRNQSVVKSLWTGTPIITLGVKAKAERLLGVDAMSLVYQTYHVTDRFDVDMSRWVRGPMKWFAPYVLLAWACVRFQRFHFFYDRGLLPQLQPGQFNPDELALLKSLGKQTFFYAYGADVRTERRTRSLGPLQLCASCPVPGKYCVCDDQRGQDNYQRIRDHATECFSQGDMIEYTPGSRNDLFYWPLDLQADEGRRYAPSYPPEKSDRPVRIVHAPNHRHFKGTQHLLDAVERLKQSGMAIELVLVEKLPNDLALEVYRSADLVFDQCVAGYHGYFALEAMAMGKPVLAFIRRPDDYLLAADECPLVNTSPQTLFDDLQRLADDRAELASIGRQGREYIECYFSLEAFSRRLKGVYLDLEGQHETTARPQAHLHRNVRAARLEA